MNSSSGSAPGEVSTDRFTQRSRYIGITTVFRGDGNYLLSHVSKDCTYEEYPAVLKDTTENILREIKQRNGWNPGDNIRLIFHTYKPLKNVEIAEIAKRAAHTVGSEQTIEFAFLTVTIEHPFLVLDPAQAGIPARYGTKKAVLCSRTRHDYATGSVHTPRLHQWPSTKSNTRTLPSPTPLLVHIHKGSTFNDLAYRSEQVLKFTGLNPRSALPARKPVSIYYSELIAKLPRPPPMRGWLDTGGPQYETSVEQMVSMMAFSTAYAILRTKLTIEIAQAPWPSPEAGFLDYLQITTTIAGAPHRPPVTQRLAETPVLASAGYQYSNPNSSQLPEYDAQWATHFRRLSQRQAFPIDRESFFYRPLDLLGISIGARHCPAVSIEDRRWLLDVIQQGSKKLPRHSRAYYLGTVAAWFLGITWPVQEPPPIDRLPLATLCLLWWLTEQKAVAMASGLRVQERDLATLILQRAFTTQESIDDLADAGLILYATQSVVNRTIRSRVEEQWHAPLNEQEAQELVTHICDRFPVVAGSLAKRHDDRETIVIADEYDVQDLLGALLKLHFADVRPEEWTPSYAGTASRMDFLLKPERIVVEAKMTRQNLGQKDVVNQLAVDILRYQSHQDCKTLVCFVYDPSGKCATPAALENDLSKDHELLRVIVLVRPKLH